MRYISIAEVQGWLLIINPISFRLMLHDQQCLVYINAIRYLKQLFHYETAIMKMPAEMNLINSCIVTFKWNSIGKRANNQQHDLNQRT